jgi:hypothetical protein
VLLRQLRYLSRFLNILSLIGYIYVMLEYMKLGKGGPLKFSVAATRYACFTLFFIIALALLGVNRMSLADTGKMCLFSGISGIIMLDGKPVENARLVRSVDKAHTKGKKADTTTTDINGYFEMPPIYDRSIIGKVLPMQFAVGQSIIVTVDGVDYRMWGGVKEERKENAESDGNPLVVKCNLDVEPTLINVRGGFFETLCSWDVKEVPLNSGF